MNELRWCVIPLLASLPRLRSAAVMQGGEYARFQFVHTLRDRPYSVRSLFHGAEHDGNLNRVISVLQLKVPLLLRYSLVYQNVQSSTGSTLILV